MERPPNLPDFDAPPLNEVVLGIQFASIPGYELIHAGEVWALYKERYPMVEHRPAAPPMFETFGDAPSVPGFSIQFGNPAEHPRFWFLSSDSHDLIQFEPNRLLHNWRQIDGVGGRYPRYERMIEAYANELKKLETLSLRFSKQKLAITQAELSYINRLYPDTDRARLFEELNFIKLPFTAEVGGGQFQYVLTDEQGPIARHYIEFASARDQFGRSFVSFSQTIRGAPRGSSIQAALDFMNNARHIIVESFSRLTTQEAHQKWQRRQ
jgi:uncharacterized protein (TIGR04255 family)